MTTCSVFNAITVSGERAAQFRNAIYELYAASDSLISSIALLPRSGSNPNNIDPAYTVEAFGLYATLRLNVLLSAIDDDQAQPIAEKPLPNGEGE